MKPTVAPVEPHSADLRLLAPAAAFWGGAVTGLVVPWPLATGLAAAAVLSIGVVSRRVASRRARTALLAVAVCLLAGLLSAVARIVAVRLGPVDELATERVSAHVSGVVLTDPQLRSGDRGAPYVVLRLRIEELTARGQRSSVRTPVVVLADAVDWVSVLPGQRVSVRGRLAPAARGNGVAALLRVRDPPAAVGRPGLPGRFSEPLRSGLRAAVRGAPGDAGGLVPALVVGDESLLPESVRADMRATGLTHLTAVSGTNVTIVLVAVLALGRWAGVRGYAVPGLGGMAVLGFVVLARPEPSVLRAAAMGVVAVIGLAVAGRRRGMPALGTAVLVCLTVDPWLAANAGFALSVLATGAILLLAPHWRDALCWLPRPLAEVLAVPLAAQVACAPVVVGIAGQASLAAVPANGLAAPAVAPVTVLGAAAAVVSPFSPTVAGWLGWLAGAGAWWIVRVAEHGADLPGAVVGWPAGLAGVAGAVLLSAVLTLVTGPVLRRPPIAALVAVLMAGVLVWAPTPGWPPRDWLLVACDVGQGDALVLATGPASALVVDTGPDPAPVDRCLDALDVHDVPLLVLTHYHADHVGGLAGVLAGRRVGQALVSPLADPREQADQVGTRLAEARVPVQVAAPGTQIAVGPARLRVLWPRRIIATGSAPNNASVVLIADVRGVRLLLAGDIEPEAQRALLRAEPGLRADVLKVPHHGSSDQEPALLAGLGSRVALVTVGDNTYGHPGAVTIELLQRAGMRVARTDRDGSVAVVGDHGGLGLATGGPDALPMR